MSEHKITVDVYASWADTPPRYRVYVDNELMTERDFIWPGHDIYIRENIMVNLQPGTHSLKVEQVGNNGIIRHKNIMLDEVPSLPEFRIVE